MMLPPSHLSGLIFEDWIDVGTGSCKDGNGEASFRVVLWPAAAALRQQLKLPQKDFHITLGFQDSDTWPIDVLIQVKCN